MRSEVYAVEARISDTHWWFAGRRRLFSRVIRALDPKASWRVLEVGVGTGANLDVLTSLGVRNVYACDVAIEAERAAARGVAFARADATRLPFKSASMDLIVAADVIEHIDDDLSALREFERVLRAGGHLMLTVPAFPSLWGPQDIVAHHRRRYRRQPLLDLVRSAGIRVVSCFHFNYVLFAPIWIARRVLLASRAEVRSENEINTPLVNRILTRVFFADVDTAATIKPPFGVSLCVMAVKRAP